MSNPYPPPPQAPQPPLFPARKPKRWPWVVGIVVAFVIGLVAGQAGNGDPAVEPVAAPEATVTVTVAPEPAVKKADTKPGPKAQPKPKPKPKARTVLSESGNGIKTTKTFTVGGDWDLRYTYDCKSLGFDGNFIVMGDGDLGDIYVNELGRKGADATHQHDGDGELALKINSTCKWTVKVVDVP